MRGIRWKAKYLTGDPLVDRLHRELVHLVGEFTSELERKEHCQELNELVAQLAGTTRDRLERGRATADRAPRGWSALHQLLRVGFPLATRSTPACRDCGLCDGLKQQVDAWLASAPSPSDLPED